LKVRIIRKGQSPNLQFSTTPLGLGNYADVDVDDVIVERRLSGFVLAVSLRTYSAFLIVLFFQETWGRRGQAGLFFFFVMMGPRAKFMQVFL